jgi:proline iminopeptidase
MRQTVVALFILFAVNAVVADDFKASDGVTLHYRSVGKGEPVIVLSGGPGFSADYVMPIAEHLSAKYNAIALDQRGTPRSPLEIYDTNTLTMAKVIDDLESLRKHLGQEKLTLAGHSWGGMLAMAYAAAHPDRVRALLLMDSGGPNLQFAEAFTKNLEARMTDAEKEGVKYWADPERRKANSRHASAETIKIRTPAYFTDRAKAKAFVDQMTDDSFEGRVFFALMQSAAFSYNVGEAMKTLAVPVLILQGKDDPVATLDTLRATFPKATVEVIDASGHFPWLEQPKAFYRIVDGFLAGLSR